MRGPLVLASRSPQRRAILTQLGITHVVAPGDVEERSVGDPLEVARENACRKALAAARDQPPGTVVLGADTVVERDGAILPKPRDAAEARRWLETLSGGAHRVCGGICVVEAGAGAAATLQAGTPGGELDSGDAAGGAALRRGPLADVAVTEVVFRALDEALIGWYLASEEWRERAGGYAIQGRGAALVERISGDYLNVVGLPVAALLRLLPDLLSACAQPS